MCGRYATTMGQLSLYGMFEAEPDPLDVQVDSVPEAPALKGPERPADLAGGRFNVAPTSLVPVVLERRSRTDEETHRYLRAMRWGLVPSWAKDPTIGNRLINARADSLLDKAAFRTPLERRRALLPASGYFEWRKSAAPAAGKAAPKQPFYITPADGSAMAFAGLWEFWRGPAGEPVVSTTIITTEAVGQLVAIHDRMPLILPAAEWDDWLSLDNDAAAVAPLLVAPDLELISGLELRPVSMRVGNVKNDDPTLLDRVADPTGSGSMGARE